MANVVPTNKETGRTLEWAILLPGPNRKRREHSYVYRLKYLNLHPGTTGCLMTWEVEGGRLLYQIAVERESAGGLRCHCTCADAVYRAEENGRHCKHVRGFLAWYQGNSFAGEAHPVPARLGA
jgi:hypothetical protein